MFSLGFRLKTTSNMFNTLTIDFQDLVAPKGAVLCVVKYTRYFTRKIVPRTSLATAAPLSSCCS